MPKDRLAALRKARAQVVDDDDDTDDIALLMNRGGFMEDFLEQTEAIRSMIEAIEADADEVKKKHSYILSTPQTDDKTKAELEDLMLRVKTNATKVRGQLKTIEDSIKDEEETKGSSAGVRIRKIQCTTLWKKFGEALNDYNACQVDYRDRCKARIQRQLEIAGRKTTDKELEDMIESGNPAIFTQEIVTETQHAKQTLKDIEARHQDILKLENSIRELNEMFTCVALQVNSQGEKLNRIEDNVMAAAEHVDKAEEQLKKAVKYQSQARRKKVMLLVAFLIIMAIAIIVLVIALAV